jgi:hypothetical protein
LCRLDGVLLINHALQIISSNEGNCVPLFDLVVNELHHWIQLGLVLDKISIDDVDVFSRTEHPID